MTDDLFPEGPQDEATAKRARDEALRRVRDNAGDWRDRALLAMNLIPGFIGTWEDIRVRLLMKGLARPHHHNAWGEVSKEALKRKLMIPTGEMRPMRLKKSHARSTKVYRVRG